MVSGNRIGADTALDTSAPPCVGNRGLALFSKLLVCAVFFLIYMGALVTSNNAGLAVPDWPTSYGENMFLFAPSKWRGIIFYEHVHRLIASGVGGLTLLLTVWTLVAEKRAWVRNLTCLALVLVILQGLLGGLTVILKLPVVTSAGHGVLGQTFFLVTILIAFAHEREFATMLTLRSAVRAPGAAAALQIIAVVYLQLIIGAVMRHSEAGLAVPDFPSMGGSLNPFAGELVARANEMRRSMQLPVVDGWQVALHLTHRFFAVFVAAFVWLKVGSLRRMSPTVAPAVSRLLSSLVVLVLIQFALGVSTLWTGRNPYIASGHVLGGALLLGLSLLLLLRLGDSKVRP